MRTIAVFNQSGGVGKTTLTRDMGYELACRKLRVLLVDADPQGTLGSFFGYDETKKKNEEMFWSKICQPGYTRKDLPVIHSSKFGLDLALANDQLTTDEIVLSSLRDTGRFLGVLDTLTPKYDVILIDCSPKISEIINQILHAVEGIVIPVQTEGKSVKAFGEVQKELHRTQTRRENLRMPVLKTVGVVPTLFNPSRRLHSHHLAELEGHCQTLGIPVLGSFRDYIAVAEAGTEEMPLQLHAPKCPAVEDVKTITANFLIQTGLHLREVKHG